MTINVETHKVNNSRANADEFMTRREVAQLLKLSTESIKRYQRMGKLDAIVVNSRVTRYRRSAVDDFIREAQTHVE